MRARAAGRATRSYAALLRYWRRLAATSSARAHEVPFGRDSLAVIDIGDASAPTILLSAGVHGDEPAAIVALASLVADGLLDRRYAYRILPCINPDGYRMGSRFNAQGMDINRSFSAAGSTREARACIAATSKRRYALTIDLHEDTEANGFYLYESTRPSPPMLNARIVAALDRAALPVQRLTNDFDLGYNCPLDGRAELARGSVISSFDRQADAFAGWPFATYLLAEHTPTALILETPRAAPLPARVRMHRLAVTTAIAQLDAKRERLVCPALTPARAVGI